MENEIAKIVICLIIFSYGIYDFIKNEKWLKENG